jgi:hypothetical protein
MLISRLTMDINLRMGMQFLFYSLLINYFCICFSLLFFFLYLFIFSLRGGDSRVATPVNWKPSEDVIVPPAVSMADAQAKYADLRVIKPYLRYTVLTRVAAICLFLSVSPVRISLLFLFIYLWCRFVSQSGGSVQEVINQPPNAGWLNSDWQPQCFIYFQSGRHMVLIKTNYFIYFASGYTFNSGSYKKDLSASN